MVSAFTQTQANHSNNFLAPTQDGLLSTYGDKDAGNRVEISASTVTLDDLSDLSKGSEKNIKELTGTCACIAVAQALAEPGGTKLDFLKLMTTINHHSDIADTGYISAALNSEDALAFREVAPGNKDLSTVHKGLVLLVKDNFSSLGSLVKDHAALALTKPSSGNQDNPENYNHETKTGSASLLLISKDSDGKYLIQTPKQTENNLKLSNLQLSIKRENGGIDYQDPTTQIATKGAAWLDFEDIFDLEIDNPDKSASTVNNEANDISVIVPADEGHYVCVNHDTASGKVNVFESAHTVSNNLRTLDFAPLNFPCGGSPRNNIEVFNSLPAVHDAVDFLKAVELIATSLKPDIGDVDFPGSSKVLVNEFKPLKSELDGVTKKVIEFSESLDALDAKIKTSASSTPEVDTRINLLLGIYKNNPTSQKYTATFRKLDDVLSKPPGDINQSDADGFLNSLNRFDLDLIKQDYEATKASL